MPTFVPRTNLPTKEPFRWSLSVARRELGVSSGTLRERLSDLNEAPGSDGRYSSRQLLGAFFGSLHKAKLKQIEEETAKFSDADAYSLKCLMNTILKSAKSFTT